MIEFAQRLHHAKSDELPKGWLRFRKYDGNSVIWLPSSGLWSLGRSNKPERIAVPKAWLAYLPKDQALHGELWHASDRCSIITSYCKDAPMINEWMELKLIVFGFPVDNGTFDPNQPHTWSSLNSRETWEESRSRVVENKIVVLPQPVNYYSVDNTWEGLVFQNPKAKYTIGRTRDVLKCKPVYEDVARVVGYEKGKTGARVGTVGGIIVDYTLNSKLSSIHGCNSPLLAKSLGANVRFVVSGLNSAEWGMNAAEKAYPVGSEIAFTFLSLSVNNVPMHANINRGAR